MPKGNTTGRGWGEQIFEFGRRSRDRRGRVLVSNGQPREDYGLICRATGAMTSVREEPVEDIIRRDGYISMERF